MRFLLILLVPVLALAGTAQDSLGLIGAIIYTSIASSPLGAAGASLAMLVIGFALRAFGNWLLKKVQTRWGRLGVGIMWRILAWLFGKGVILENAVVDPALTGSDKFDAEMKLKTALSKDRAGKPNILTVGNATVLPGKE